MAIATPSSGGRRSVLRHAPFLALGLAVIAVALLTVGPIGWRAGWWHFRFAFQTLMPWAAYFGIAALGVSVLTLLLGRSRIESRGIAIAIIAFVAGGLVTYVPWHYNQIRQQVPPIHDITTDPGIIRRRLSPWRHCARPQAPTGSPMRGPGSPSSNGWPIPKSFL